MATYQGEAINREIKQHQTAEHLPWRYTVVVEEVHPWFDRADRDFDLGLPTPMIAIEPLRWNTIATYQLGRNLIGARTTITFNEVWLLRLPFTDTITPPRPETPAPEMELRLSGRPPGPGHLSQRSLPRLRHDLPAGQYLTEPLLLKPIAYQGRQRHASL